MNAVIAKVHVAFAVHVDALTSPLEAFNGRVVERLFNKEVYIPPGRGVWTFIMPLQTILQATLDLQSRK